MAYEVHLDVFDGPFSLLLQLISAQEVEIYEVRLADIVDAFVVEMKAAGSIDLDASTEFLLIAATLVELKCRRLIPGQDELDLEDELALYEARDYLLARLLECKTFNAAATALAALEQAASRSVARRAGADERFVEVVPDLLEGVTVERLADVARRALAERPVPVIGDAHVLVDEVSVAATLEDLAVELARRGEASFRDLTVGAATTAHVVACFLALLELYKQELVDLDQTDDVRHPHGALDRAAGPGPRGPRGAERVRRSGPGADAVSPFPEEWRPEAAAIEAVLTVATDPVPAGLLAELLEVPVERADEVCEALRLAYEEEERGFELVRVAGGYRLQSHPAYRGYVERFILDDAPHRLSPAAP